MDTQKKKRRDQTGFRFNLIIHGMVGVIEPKNREGFDIYVPLPDQDMDVAHFAIWGLPDDPSKPVGEQQYLEAIPNENFLLDFAYQAPIGGDCSIDPTEAIFLRGVFPKMDYVQSRISVPAPSVIRRYRGLETLPGDDTDSPTHHCLKAEPKLVYEVVVLSYLCVTSQLILIGDAGTTKQISDATGTNAVNFGIYYQATSEPDRAMRHSTSPFDSMFQINDQHGKRVGVQTGGLTTQSPSSNTPADNAPDVLSPGTGLLTFHLWSLSELGRAPGAGPSMLDGIKEFQCGGDITSCGFVAGSEG